MKDIEISDITAAVNKKETLNNSLFLIDGIGGDGRSKQQDDDKILMQPISTVVYTDKKKLGKNKIEIINENQNTDNKNNEIEVDKQEKENNIKLGNEISVEQTNIPSKEKNTHSKQISSSLGQSIILLLNSNNKALTSAIDLYKKSSFIKCTKNYLFL